VTLPPAHYIAPGDARAERRILLVSPAYPPCAEVGALRWEKITDVAAERGWGLDVITGAAGPLDRIDERRLLTLPAGTRVWTIPMPVPMLQRVERGVVAMVAPLRRRKRAAASEGATREGGNGATMTAAMPGALPLPSPDGATAPVSAMMRNMRAASYFTAWLEWGEAVVELARELAREHRPAVVASSGPPHMTHEAARRVAHAIGRRLAIDLRDPWFVSEAEPDELRGTTWRRRSAAYEARACADASLVVVNTESCAELMRERYPQFASKVTTVMNGADDEVRAFSDTSGDTFDIVHTGNVYGGRDPRPLFRGIARFLERAGDAAGAVRVRFVGAQRYEGVPLEDMARESGLGDRFSCTPPMTRPEALRLSGRAAVNVVLQQDWTHSIPSKVFEYMQFPAWILALAQPGDAISQLLGGSTSPPLSPQDTDAIADFLATRFERWSRGERDAPFNADGRFDRKRQAGRLLDALEALA